MIMSLIKGNHKIHHSQWHLKKTTINSNVIDESINVEPAWRYTKGNNIKVAIIDDGIDTSHPVFQKKGKICNPRDIEIGINDPSHKLEYEGHGTKCSGIIAADNNIYPGVAPNATLMPIRINNSRGSSDKMKAFYWAANSGADIICCSWGPFKGNWKSRKNKFNNLNFRMPEKTKKAINYATKNGRSGKGCIIIWAAGNSNSNIKPNDYEAHKELITVSACNDCGIKSIYSDYGSAIWCCAPSNDYPNPWIALPNPPLTDGIPTTRRTKNNENIYTYFGGTSCSAAIVSGVIALILSVNPQLTWKQVKGILKTTSDKIDPKWGNYSARGHSKFYGFGRVNAGKAIMKAKNISLNTI